MGIHLQEFLGYILAFTAHAGRMLKSLGYAGSVHVDIRLSSMLGVPWLQLLYGQVPQSAGCSELDDRVAFSIETNHEQLCDKRDSVAADILRYILFAVGLHGLIEQEGNAEKLIGAGYAYNSWNGS